MKNEIHVEVGPTEWVAKPIPAWTGSLGRTISALFSTHYKIYALGSEQGEPQAHVSYYPLKDQILIQIGEEKWQTRSTRFGPAKFDHEGVQYTIFEKMTGRFAIERTGTVVAEGKCRFRSVVVTHYLPGLETFLGYLVVGLLIRNLMGELAV